MNKKQAEIVSIALKSECWCCEGKLGFNHIVLGVGLETNPRNQWDLFISKFFKTIRLSSRDNNANS